MPVTLASTNACRACVATCGLCSVAAWSTTSTPSHARSTTARSAIDPTTSVNGDGEDVEPTARAARRAQRSHQRLAEVTGRSGDEDGTHRRILPCYYRDVFPADGHCACKTIQYRMTVKPMFVHCCHCRWCQRETGSAFVLNAMVEADRIDITSGTPDVVVTPSESGRGQQISRCPTCRIAVWSTYSLPDDPVRSRRHARQPRPRPARRSHLHVVETAVGRVARRRAGLRGVLRLVEAVAGRQPRASRFRGCRGERALEVTARFGITVRRCRATLARC